MLIASDIVVALRLEGSMSYCPVSFAASRSLVRHVDQLRSIDTARTGR